MTGPAQTPRPDGRALDALRPVEMTPGFHRNAEGSVLYRAGCTVVLCTASVDAKVPPFLEGKGKGWLTAEYQMHPRASPAGRESRDGRGKAPGGRTLEIQRLVGRALRAAVELEKLGERTITIDCDVLEADGGTRTASVTGGYVALVLALARLKEAGKLTEPVLREPVAATSVGCMASGALALDLVYREDSKAEVDLNVVATAGGAIVEVQGTAEGSPVPRATIDRMVDLALRGVGDLVRVQRVALERAGVDLEGLRRKP
jgi:ribonuclease PH